MEKMRERDIDVRGLTKALPPSLSCESFNLCNLRRLVKLLINKAFKSRNGKS